MKVGFDTHHLQLERGGTKRVTTNILTRLEKLTHVVTFMPSYKLEISNNFWGKLYKHFIRLFWVHIHLPYLCYVNKIDVLFSPEFNTPLFTTCKRIVLALDAHTRAQPMYVNKFWLYFIYIPFIETAIRHADLVLTISEFSKRELSKYMKIPDNNIKVIYCSLDDGFIKKQSAPNNHLNTEQALSKMSLVSKNYFLFIGTFEARKNIIRIIEAFIKLKTTHGSEYVDTKLLIVGQAAAGIYSDVSNQIKELIAASHLNDSVILCGYLDDDLLPLLYKNAIALVFPSTYEGFGLPILEAYANGTPVITSNICSMPEVAGDAAVLVNPFDVSSIHDGMKYLIDSKEVHQQLMLKGYDRLEFFSWDNSVNSLLNAMNGVLLERK